MDDREDRIITAGPYELADDYHARILAKVYKVLSFPLLAINMFSHVFTYPTTVKLTSE